MQAGKRGLWGRALLQQMELYNHQVGLKIVGECLPQERNRVTLTEEHDQYGLPTPRITYSYCDNDQRLMRTAAAGTFATCGSATGRSFRRLVG